MANVVKKAVFNLMDKAFTERGYVLAIRAWKPGSMYEIDLHLPATDMSKWKTIPRIKCKVDDFDYRDYTPALWDVEKRTCTVFIETGHSGRGSSWAKNLRVGDTIGYASAHAAQLPGESGPIACFGDGSSLGHFLALKQLTDGEEHPMRVTLSLSEQYQLPENLLLKNPEFKFIMLPKTNSLEHLSEMAAHEEISVNNSVYVAGHIPMVTSLRKTLKKNPYLNARIFAHGFWS